MKGGLRRGAWVLAGALAGPAAADTELVVATVNNGHMIEMQKLGRHFEAAHPGIRLKWVTLEEGVLRQRVTTDIATRGGQFDVMTIGLYETPIWGRRGWLHEISTNAAYDLDDLLPAIRRGLSVQGRLYAAPFYGEASMLMYRKDLVERAGLQVPDRPRWDQVADLARRLHDPARGVYGICLRGKPGWGENMALVSTMVNTFGGQWFDMGWRPQIDTRPWREAVGFYVDLLRRHGPPDSAGNGFNEVLALFAAGRCAMWVDASVAASFLADVRHSQVAGKVAYAQAPSQVTTKGATWLWSWALAVPAGSRKLEQAQTFVRWATSKDYIRLVARTNGWAAVPTGTRRSTYASPEFRQAAGFAAVELQAIEAANPDDATLPPSPYVGVQFAAIPEFQAIGVAVGRQVSLALDGKTTVETALKAGQIAAEREMQRSGHHR